MSWYKSSQREKGERPDFVDYMATFVTEGKLEYLKKMLEERDDISAHSISAAAHMAISYGQAHVAKYLFDNFTIDTIKFDTYGAFLRAIRKGHLDSVKLCVMELGLDVNQGRGQPLLQAVFLPSTDILKFLLEHGASSEHSETGEEPILQAAKTSRLDAVKLLVEHEGNQNIHHSAPLRWAVRQNDLPMAQYLVRVGADPHISPHGNDATAYMIAKEYEGQNGSDMVRLFESFGKQAQINGPDIYEYFEAACEIGNVDYVRTLIYSGNIDLNNNNAAVALMKALYADSEGVADLLISYGVNLKKAGENHLATFVSLGDTLLVKKVLSLGIPIGGMGEKALRVACKKDYIDIARVLIEAGADPANTFQNEALHSAIVRKNMDMVKLLVNNGAPVSIQIEMITEGLYEGDKTYLPVLNYLYDIREKKQAQTKTPSKLDFLLAAIEMNNIDYVNKIFDSGFAIENWDRLGYAQLNLNFSGAIGQNHTEMVDILLRHGFGRETVDNETFAMLAEKGRADMLKVFITHGFDIHANDDKAFEIACRKGHEDVIRYMLEDGSDPNHYRVGYGFHYLCEKVSHELIQLFIEKGKIVHHLDYEGARSLGRDDIADYLKSVYLEQQVKPQ